jgi:heme-degrading monooxygenase HmoA
MIVTIFRSRLRPGVLDEYTPLVQHMSALAKAMPGYISHKGFVAEDGERVTVVEFDSEASHKAWAMHPEHMEAKKRGRDTFYSDYRVQICNVIRDSNDRPQRKAAE